MLAKLKLFGISKNKPLFPQLSALFETKITDLYSLHESASPYPGVLNWIYSQVDFDLKEKQLTLSPTAVRNGEMESINLLQLDQPFWPIRRRMIAFMHGLRKHGFYRDLRFVLYRFLRSLYVDYGYIYHLMCGTIDYEMRELTTPFLEKRYNMPAKRVHHATCECIRRGFTDVDFQTHIERQAVKTERWDALYWFCCRLYGTRKQSWMLYSRVLLLQNIGPYFRDLAHRHTQTLVDSTIFSCYGDFPRVAWRNDTFEICLQLSKLTFTCTLRSESRVRIELRSARFALLVEQYPFFKEFEKCAIDVGL